MHFLFLTHAIALFAGLYSGTTKRHEPEPPQIVEIIENRGYTIHVPQGSTVLLPGGSTFAVPQGTAMALPPGSPRPEIEGTYASPTSTAELW